jgi:hypothetical protein
VARNVSFLFSPSFGRIYTYDGSFILKGIATILVAIAAYFILYKFPDTASFLTLEERAWVVHGSEEKTDT